MQAIWGQQGAKPPHPRTPDLRCHQQQLTKKTEVWLTSPRPWSWKQHQLCPRWPPPSPRPRRLGHPRRPGTRRRRWEHPPREPHPKSEKRHRQYQGLPREPHPTSCRRHQRLPERSRRRRCRCCRRPTRRLPESWWFLCRPPRLRPRQLALTAKTRHQRQRLQPAKPRNPQIRSPRPPCLWHSLPHARVPNPAMSRSLHLQPQQKHPWHGSRPPLPLRHAPRRPAPS
mmetsp:Transcript_46717/g.123430  ORF Transcript_46717/g.123430 Transcript_46717/m.123430 type:complete len:227 (-) Transcript_46717:5268-5948(-)